MIDVETYVIDDFIIGLKFPKFAAYVVRQLAKEYEVSLEEATTMWTDYQKRMAA